MSDVAPLDQLMPLALQLAERICDNAPLSVRAAKLAALRGAEMSLNDGLTLEQAFFGIAARYRGPVGGAQGLRREAQAALQGAVK